MRSLSNILNDADLKILNQKSPSLYDVLTELQGEKFTVVDGAAANTNIAVAGIATVDTLKAVVGVKKSKVEMAKQKVVVVTGAAANTDIAIAGLLATDTILSIVGIDGDNAVLADSVKDYLAAKSAQTAGNIQLNVVTTAYRLVVTYISEPADPASLVSFTGSVTSAGNIQVTADASDYKLLVAWVDQA